MRKRKRNRSWTTPEKEDTWNFDEVEDFLNVILLVVISKYRTNFLLQSVTVKFSWCETLRLKPKNEQLIWYLVLKLKMQSRVFISIHEGGTV